MSTILIAGDLIWDFNLVKTGGLSATYSEPFDRTVMSVTPGGAWFLAEVVREALGDLPPSPDVVLAAGAPQASIKLPTRVASDAGKPVVAPAGDPLTASAFTVWDQYPLRRNLAEDKKHLKSWRVAEFLGCKRPYAAELAAGTGPSVLHEHPEPDLVVLEDLGLGFRETPSLWPRAVLEGRPRRIVLKLANLDDRNPLLEHLLGIRSQGRPEDPDRWARRLTIVIYADDLRRRGAVISQGLSWDRTREELVHEFTSGRSAQDLALARRIVVAFGLEGVASFTRCDRRLGKDGSDPDCDAASDQETKCVRPRAVLERLLLHPDETEGTFRKDRKGRMFGAASLLTAAVARHELSPADYPLFVALGRGMQAARLSHETGAVVEHSGAGVARTQLDLPAIARTLHPRLQPLPKDAPGPRPPAEPADCFRTATPQYALEHQPPAAKGSDLLHDFAGTGVEAMTALAMAVVMQGVDTALSGVPKTRVGKFKTVDRDEVERVNTLRGLIETYLDNPEDKRPLSIVVFGPPGSGKSFAIKELAAAVFPEKPEVLEFNLSQFVEGSDQLHQAFHRVRDASVKGKVPLVFWDEFDSDRLKWLKQFLAPMQDAEFRAGGIVHPFAKCLFVFAGGTAASYDAFMTRWSSYNRAEQFRDLKGPDFISRLSGYLNIKGSNPSHRAAADAVRAPETADDPAVVIRRAIVLRTNLERFYPRLIDHQRRARISAGVVRGFLRVRRYRHDTRSLEAVMRMSRLEGARYFGPSQLPTAAQLDLHVSSDFLELVQEGELDVPLIETMAAATHTSWKAKKESQGYVYGEKRNDHSHPKTHPLMLPYEKLSDADKERNRQPAREFRAKLAELGVQVARSAPGQSAGGVRPELRNALISAEHDRWLREKLQQGWEWAETTDDERRQHRSVAAFAALDEADQVLDQEIVDTLLRELERTGYALIKPPGKSSET